MARIIIQNMHELYDDIRDAVYIKCDRTSNLGNPFKMHNYADRDRVCDKYEQYFYHVLIHRMDVRMMLQYMGLSLYQGRDVVLQCWCAPKRCHCETIKKFVEQRADRFADIFGGD